MTVKSDNKILVSKIQMEEARKLLKEIGGHVAEIKYEMNNLKGRGLDLLVESLKPRIVYLEEKLSLIESLINEKFIVNEDVGENLLFGENEMNLDRLYYECNTLVLGDVEMDGEEKDLDENGQRDKQNFESITRYDKNKEKEHRRIIKNIGENLLFGDNTINLDTLFPESEKIVLKDTKIYEEDIKSIKNKVLEENHREKDRRKFKSKALDDNNREKEYLRINTNIGGHKVNANKLKYFREGTTINFHNKIKYKKGSEVLKSRKKVKLRRIG